MMQVLIVDDEYYIRQGMKQVIAWEQLGCEICADVESGEDALAFLKTHPVDLVIVDIRMASMSGLELCDIINREYPNIESIIVTGYNEFKYTQEAIRKNVVDYILKPINEQELICAVARAKERILEKKLHDEKMWTRQVEKCILDNDEAELDHILALLKEHYRRTKWDRRDYFALDHIVEEAAKNLDVKNLWEFNESDAGVDLADMDQAFAEIGKRLKDVLYAKNSKGRFAVIERVKQYVEEHYSEKITLQVVAREMHFNVSYLSNLFSEIAEVNYSEYVTNVRIRKAKKMLRETDLSIEEVSRRTGFSDAKYFSKVFKKTTGRTPREYRRA